MSIVIKYESTIWSWSQEMKKMVDRNKNFSSSFSISFFIDFSEGILWLFLVATMFVDCISIHDEIMQMSHSNDFPSTILICLIIFCAFQEIF